MKIVIINVTGGSGKDTFVSLCQKIYNRPIGNYMIGNCSTIDVVKSIAKSYGWEGTKTEKDRKFLSDLKDLLEEYNQLPTKSVERVIDIYSKNNRFSLRNSKDFILFIHCREPKNIDYFVKKYGAITLLVHNPRVKDITSNHADRDVYDYEYDFTIENNGTLEDLEIQAKNFIEEIKSSY